MIYLLKNNIMELIKLNEAYTLTDNTEKGWSIYGQDKRNGK